jgi:hypothetical protein
LQRSIAHAAIEQARRATALFWSGLIAETMGSCGTGRLVPDSTRMREWFMDARDLRGKRGEFIASERLLNFCGRRIPYFDPYLLGEKFPTYDLLVELTGHHASKPYFLAQVKSTQSGGKKGMTDLKVRLSARDVRLMIHCPIPTYLIGVDEKAEVAYIVSIHGSLAGGISSIPTAFPLEPGTLKALYDEVPGYWRKLARSSREKTSVFVL